MNKPITIIRQEFIEELVELINKYQLPAFVIIGVIKELLPVLKEQEEKQLITDKETYKQYISKQEENVSE